LGAGYREFPKAQGDMQKLMRIVAVAATCSACNPLLQHQFPGAIRPVPDVPLVVAAERDELTTVRGMLDGGVDVDTTNANGWNALMVSANVGNTDMVNLLLERGANPQSQTLNQETPLMFAADTGQVDIVQVLLARRANVHARDRRGRTALIHATLEGSLNMLRLESEGLIGRDPSTLSRPKRDTMNPIAVIEALLAAGADVNAAANDGETALMATGLRQTAESASLLIAHGANVNAQRKVSQFMGVLYAPTALSDATEMGPSLLDVMKVLLDAGADVNRDAPLIVAAGRGHVLKVKLLLDYHADPNARNSIGQSPLMAAAEAPSFLKGEPPATQAQELRDHQECVQLLLDAGADRAAKDNHGRTALDYAGNNRRWPIAKLLRPTDPGK
jgi:ankyrin repeat protein